MTTKLLALLALGFVYGNACAQEPDNVQVQETAAEHVINHRVAFGETVVLIAKKYLVRPSDIYEFNPDAVEGLSTGMLLKIPLDRAVQAEQPKKEEEPATHIATIAMPERKKTVVKESAAPALKATVASAVTQPEPVVLPDNGVFEVTHSVKDGETLTGLARKYNTTVTAITNANKQKLRHGLQKGQELTIPAGPTPETLDGVIMHSVKSGETLFSLAKQYNTTVEAITEYNKRKLKNGLQAGQKLSIMPGTAAPAALETESIADVIQETPVKTEEAVKQPEPVPDVTPRTITHIIKADDTLDKLAAQYHTTAEAIKKQNTKKLKKGLQAGQEISIPAYTQP
ncbi:LysM peptidoglycan-binding domain-containing protein [Flavobacterium sp.]|uniref:LysM peptidoglycan-binding domain-containing protein n=1 Tax=Flavobacterium sp. TaxID=239 RepID=UPI00261998F8|nr:LysM peptidoglycan-binding domain-containing protein [Flavobacterium sp.]